MDKIGKYEVLEEIGSGGFGTVYKGRDPFIKRIVAIKTCTSELEEVRLRFYREAEIVGSLQHVNITMVHDFGIQDDVPFLVQEYLSGEDLDEVIKNREDIDVRTRLRYLLQIARGLEYAHDNGVVHRDIKPANIRRLEDGRIKVMDFGIAMLADLETRLTRTGMLVGTAAYLAPEQIQGTDIDHRCDIFSFGVLAYEILTYERPFGGATVSNLLYQILNQEPEPLPTLWPDCPETLNVLLNGCLRKDREQRPQSFAEIIEVLLPLAETTDTTARTMDHTRLSAVTRAQEATLLQSDGPGRRPQPVSKAFVRPSRMALAATAVILLGVATVVVWLYRGQWGPLAVEGSETAVEASAAEPTSAEETPEVPSTAIDMEGVGSTGPTETAEVSEPVLAPPPATKARPSPAEQAPPRQQPARRQTPVPQTPTQAATVPASRPTTRAPAVTTPPASSAQPEPVQTDPVPLPTVASTVAVEPEPAEEPPPAPTPKPVDETVGVRAALVQYEAAYENLDADGLAAVWPSLGDTQRSRLSSSFEDYESIELDLDDCQIDVQGTTATAACRVRRVVRPKVGSRQTDQRATTFHLRKSGDRWVIDRL